MELQLYIGAQSLNWSTKSGVKVKLVDVICLLFGINDLHHLNKSQNQPWFTFCSAYGDLLILAAIQREGANQPHINQQECYLDKWIFITVTQLKDQRCKCWERKKGILTWTMRLMSRASEETHTDGEWWRNPIRTLISTERILQNVK